MKSMKLIVISLSFGVLAMGQGKVAGADENGGKSGWHYHFAGSAALKSTSATNAQAVLGLPIQRELANQTLDHLAAVPQKLLGGKTPAGATDRSDVFRALLDDLLAAESVGAVTPDGERWNLALAVRLDAVRARFWMNNLNEVASGWKLGSVKDVKNGGASGWEIERDQAPRHIQVLHAKDWVLLAAGSEAGQLDAWLDAIEKNGRPVKAAPDELLDAEGDLAMLKKFLPVPVSRPALAHLTVTPQDEYLRHELTLDFESPLHWKAQPWRIPAGLIHDPVISFTAAQGISDVLREFKGVSGLGLNPLPEQYIGWAMSEFPFQTYFAMPYDHATSALKQIAPHATTLIETNFPDFPGRIEWVTNRSEIVWKGLPFIVPALQPVQTNRDEYILGSIFPLSRSRKPVPPELFQQVVGRKDLVYYDWEITQARVINWQQYYQLYDIIQKQPLATTNSLQTRWLKSVAPFLGNTVTEATVTGPSQIKVVRKSHLGLTGFELVTLARWLDRPEFPFASPKRSIYDRSRGLSNGLPRRGQPVPLLSVPKTNPPPARKPRR